MSGGSAEMVLKENLNMSDVITKDLKNEIVTIPANFAVNENDRMKNSRTFHQKKQEFNTRHSKLDHNNDEPKTPIIQFENQPDVESSKY